MGLFPTIPKTLTTRCPRKEPLTPGAHLSGGGFYQPERAGVQLMGANSLPKHIPDGTHYIIEGRKDASGKMQIVSRQLILPNGREIDLIGNKSFERPRAATRIKRVKRKGRTR